MKLSKEKFEFLINVALDTKDEEYFKELCYKQENGLFEEYIDNEEVDISERDRTIAEMERLAREITGIINRQFSQSLKRFPTESEDNMKGRYEVFVDSISDAILDSWLRYDQTESLLLENEGEDDNGPTTGKPKVRRGDEEATEEE